MSDDVNWMAVGNCRGYHPDFFFPADAVGIRAARAVCASCSVSDDCLRYAIVHRVEDGVWGGTSEEVRRRMIRGRRLAARQVQAPSPRLTRLVVDRRTAMPS